jgi:hypothetical protein
MTTVTDLDLPVSGYTAPDFSADRYHHQLAQARAQGWLAWSPRAYIVLARESGEFFLRSRATAFPGRQIGGTGRRGRHLRDREAAAPLDRMTLLGGVPNMIKD